MDGIFIGREPIPERIIVRGRDFTSEVVQVLERRQASAMKRAERELAAAHRAGGERRTHYSKTSGNGGEVTAMIHPVHAAMMVNKFGSAECLSDRGVIRDYQKQFPASRVRSRSARAQVGWTGGSGRVGRNSTFRKTYK